MILYYNIPASTFLYQFTQDHFHFLLSAIVLFIPKIRPDEIILFLADSDKAVFIPPSAVSIAGQNLSLN